MHIHVWVHAWHAHPWNGTQRGTLHAPTRSCNTYYLREFSSKTHLSSTPRRKNNRCTHAHIHTFAYIYMYILYTNTNPWHVHVHAYASAGNLNTHPQGFKECFKRCTDEKTLHKRPSCHLHPLMHAMDMTSGCTPLQSIFCTITCSCTARACSYVYHENHEPNYKQTGSGFLLIL